MEYTETWTRDDLTGDKLIDSKRVTVTIDGDEFTLDFDPKTLDAMLTAFRDHDYAPLRRIFTGEPEPKETAKPKAKTPDGQRPDGKEVNAWLKSIGRESEVTRGQVAKALVDEYITAHET